MFTPIEFTLSGQKYRQFRKLTAFEQFDLVRKMAPILASFATLSDNETKTPQTTLSIAGVLNNMPNGDVQLIHSMVLQVIQTYRNNVWTAIYTSATHQIMFDDIGAYELFAMIVKIMECELIPFFTKMQENQVLSDEVQLPQTSSTGT